MTSVAADTLLVKPIERWLTQPASYLSFHAGPDGGRCCALARDWLLAMARSHDPSYVDRLGRSAPLWLNDRFKWGPTAWPAHWCEAVKAREIDCGVFSAFAREIFRAKGYEAYAGQAIQLYGARTVAHLDRKWRRSPASRRWLGDDFIYHEVCAVRTGETELEVYDATQGAWLDPDREAGYGSVKAIRIEAPVALEWRGHSIDQDRWSVLR